MTLTIDDALDKKWYYTVELKPGQYTKGFSFKSISVVRRALEALDVQNASILDISTMEAMFPILLSRRGGRVLCTDSIDLTPRVQLLKDVYGAQFQYMPHMPVDNFADAIFAQQASKSFTAAKPLRSTQNSAFGYDMVMSAGLIYHVLNPMDHLVTYRKLVKSGGILVMEAAVLLSDEIEMRHDLRHGRQTFGGNATWFVSTKALEMFLKSCFFEPLGYSYIRSVETEDSKLARISIVARAVEERAFSDDEMSLIKGSELLKNYDFKPLYAAAQLTGKAQNPPSYTPGHLHDGTDMRGSTILDHAPLDYDDKYLTLSLDDR